MVELARVTVKPLRPLTTWTWARTPQRLALKNDGPVVLAGTGVDLGQVVAVDEFGNTVSTGIGDVSFASNGLGFIENGHYTAGSAGHNALLVAELHRVIGPVPGRHVAVGVAQGHRDKGDCGIIP